MKPSAGSREEFNMQLQMYLNENVQTVFDKNKKGLAAGKTYSYE
jgi:hypothetical protein